MLLEIDVSSNEALYIQICNQIILGIATDELHEGDVLPSVRALAENIGINMHTVNKAYSVLREEGFVRLDRRKGAVVSLNPDKSEELKEICSDLQVILARAACKNISREEIHELVDKIMDQFGGK